VLLVAAALMPDRDVAVDVAAGLFDCFSPGARTAALVQVGVDHLDDCAPAGRGRFDFD